VQLGLALKDVSRCAIDLSDGLCGDLNHILKASQLGAEIFLGQIPRSGAMLSQPLDRQHQFLLEGGDDYELLFTAAPQHHLRIRELAAQLGLGISCIGRITAQPGLKIWNEQGQALMTRYASFDHFQTSRWGLDES
jgi:thiamine-monophosphate kinase